MTNDCLTFMMLPQTVAILLVLVLLVDSQAQLCLEPGQCEQSLIVLRTTSAYDANTCLQQCKDFVDGCQWFTFFGNSNGCVLYGNCEKLNTENCKNCASGQVNCDPQQPKCNAVGQCLGNVDLVTNTNNANDCLKRCQANDGCTWYTYESQSTLCEEFFDCPSLDESCTTCISGESTCPINSGLTKMIVGGGNGVSVEVIDLSNPLTKCLPLPDFPIELDGAVGFLHKGVPLVCGGYTLSRIVEDTKNCWLMANNNTWQVYNEMSAGHRYPSIVTVSDTDTTLIMGGADGDNAGTQNIEVLKDDSNEWSTFTPKLPFPLWQQCTIMVNVTTMLVMGGFDGKSRSYFHTFGNDDWRYGPSMINGRNLLGCGILNDKEQSYVIAAGGQDSSTEILDLSTMKWTSGPDLPDPRRTVLLIPFNNYLILVVGSNTDKQLYKLSTIDGPWEPMEQTMNITRSNHFAFLIPDRYTTCS